MTNDFYSLVAEFIRNKPDIPPRGVWAHFTALAKIGGMPVLHGVDGQFLVYSPRASRPDRISRVAFSSFRANLAKIRKTNPHRKAA